MSADFDSRPLSNDSGPSSGHDFSSLSFPSASKLGQKLGKTLEHGAISAPALLRELLTKIIPFSKG